MVFGRAIYFAGQLSATYPPIVTYTFDFDKNEFETILKKIDNEQKFTITFTDTTGLDLDSEYNYYFNILNTSTKDKYLLKFKSDKNVLLGERIKIDLIGLNNVQKNIVIYEPDEGAENVKRKFEDELLNKIIN
jgi:hypothetical protein